MANTNLYNVLSGLLSAAQNFNGKIGSKNAQNGTIYEQLTAISGVAGNAMSQMSLANGATSGLVYAPTTGGDVNIAAGVITVKNEAVTSGKLASSVNSDIADGKAAYGIVSSTDGEWHKHANKTVLDGVTSTKVSNWDAAYASTSGGIVSSVTLTKDSSPTTGYAATYTLSVNGTAQTTKIDIVKDKFLKGASIVTGSWSANVFTEGTGSQKAIKLEMYTNDNGVDSDDTAVTPIYINPADFITAYTGGTNIQITAGNVIQLSGTIADANIASASAWNTAAAQGAAYAAASGNYATADDTLTSGRILLGDGNKKVKASSYQVSTTSSTMTASVIPNGAAVTGYIAAQNFQTAITNPVTGSSLTVDQIVLGNGNSTVKASSYTIGNT